MEEQRQSRAAWVWEFARRHILIIVAAAAFSFAVQHYVDTKPELHMDALVMAMDLRAQDKYQPRHEQTQRMMEHEFVGWTEVGMIGMDIEGGAEAIRRGQHFNYNRTKLTHGLNVAINRSLETGRHQSLVVITECVKADNISDKLWMELDHLIGLQKWDVSVSFVAYTRCYDNAYDHYVRLNPTSSISFHDIDAGDCLSQPWEIAKHELRRAEHSVWCVIYAVSRHSTKEFWSVSAQLRRARHSDGVKSLVDRLLGY